MAEPSKFAGALARLKLPPVAEEAEPESPAVAPPVVAVTPAIVPAAKGKGRPPGKRSNPAWKPYTLLLQEKTKKLASRRLDEADTGQDLSELVDQLLNEWLER